MLLLAFVLAGCGARAGQVTPAATPTTVALVALAPTATAIPPTAPPSPTPTNTPTPPPTATPTVTPTPTATLAPTAAPSQVLLTGMNHQYQTYNNCGPASVAEALGYYDIKVSQGELNQQGFRAMTSPTRLVSALAASKYDVQMRAYALPPTDERTLGVVRYLLANRIPVIALQRLNFDERISHYRVIQGYDDQAKVVIADDPYYGPGYQLSYDDFLGLFPNTRPPATLMPVYKPDQAAFVERLMAEWGATPR